MAPRPAPRKSRFDRIDAVIIGVILLLAVVLTIRVISTGLGYSATTLNAPFYLSGYLAVLGTLLKHRWGQLRLGQAAESIAYVMAVSLLGSVASAALAVQGGPLIDDTALWLDRVIFPWANWLDLLTVLRSRPDVLRALSYIYVSLNWQPWLLLGLMLVTGRTGPLRRFVCAYSIGVGGCVLPFAWCASLGPYAHFGIAPGSIEGNLVTLPFDMARILIGLRSGAIDTISVDTVTGLINMPSFHACAAVLLAWSFWSYRFLRWLMLVLNIFMAFTAIPIGGHYFCDIVAGIAVAGIAICLTTWATTKRPLSQEATDPVRAPLIRLPKIQTGRKPSSAS